MAWPDLEGAAEHSVLAVPLGSTEQHGPHLPLATDALIAGELARLLAEARPDVIVAPVMPYGASGEHAGFPGTLSIGTDALTSVLVELGRSADAFSGLIFVNAHGGNAVALASAVTRLRAEGRNARAWPDPAAGSSSDADAGTDTHAGRRETSLMLALAPAAVRPEAAAAGCTTPLGQIMPILRRAGVAAVSPNGILGDPAGASAAEGRSLLRSWATDLVGSLDGWPG